MTNGKTQYRVVTPIRRGEDENGRIFWHRIGTAFENPRKDGAAPSITLKLDSLPKAGEDIVLFVDDGKGRTAGATK